MARAKMTAESIGGLLVVDAEGRLLGMLTARDILLLPDSPAAVETVMTPRVPPQSVGDNSRILG